MAHSPTHPIYHGLTRVGASTLTGRSRAWSAAEPEERYLSLPTAHLRRPAARSLSWLAALAAASRSPLPALSSCALAALAAVSQQVST